MFQMESESIWMPTALRARSDRLKVLLEYAKSKPFKLPEGKMTKSIADVIVSIKFPEMTNHTRHSYAESLVQLYNRDAES